MYLILSVLRQNFLVIITQCPELSSLPRQAAHAWITFCCILQDNLQLWGHKAENAGLQQHAAPHITAVTRY